MGKRPHPHITQFLITAVIFCESGICLFGQAATGGVNGTVTDPAKAAIPGATVTLKNLGTNIENTAPTNASGVFTFINVQPGQYTFTVKDPGFKTAEVPQFTVGVNQTVTEDVSLSVGGVNESVVVQGQAELVQMSSTELGSVIAQHAVEELPLNGRNFTQLLTLTPGATPVSTSQSASIGTNDGNTVALPNSSYSNPSIHGQWNRSSIYYLDGVINTDFRTTTYTLLPEIDLIQEFKVQSHNDKAEYGGVTGGIINVVSRSGSNEFHGSAFEFVRNDFFNARDSFTEGKRNSPFPFRQNQFGATFSGPIFKNKTFVSGGYNGWRYTKPIGTLLRVPTPQEISGDFSNSIIRRNMYDPTTTRPDPNNPNALLRDPFANNLIPASRISPLTQGFIKTYFPPVNYSDPTYNAIVSDPQINNDNGWQIKVDHQVNGSNSGWFRYSSMDTTQVTPSSNVQGSQFEMKAKNIGAGILHIFSPSLILDIRGGFASRPFTITSYHSAGLGPLTQLGFAGIDQFQAGNIGLQTPWASNAGSALSAGVGAPQPRGNPVWSLSPNLSWIHGNHNFKTGFQWIDVNRLQISPGLTYNFQDDPTASPQLPGKSGASLASALLGLPSNYTGTQAKASTIDFDIAIWGLYAQDEWKLSPTVTITTGLRFDHVNHVDVHSLMNNGPNMLTGNWEIGATTMPPPCNQVGIAPCIPGNGLQDVPFSDHIVLAKDKDRWRQPEWDQFGPRVGIAWRFTEKMVLRAGYGLFFDSLPAQSQTYQNTVNQWPYSAGFSNSANQIGSPLVYIGDLQGKFPKPLPAPSPWTTSTWFSAPDRKDARSHQWNVEVQRQLSANMMVSAAYIGSVSHNLDIDGIANTAQSPGPGTPAQVNARRPYPWMGSFFYDTSNASGNYNGLELKADRRFARGFQALVSYTWSKAIDTGSSGWYSAENGPGGSSAYQNYYDLNGSRSVSSYDIPHFLSVSTSWELPVGPGKSFLNHGPGAWILGGWQVNTIAQLRSGQPYNLVVTGDVANIGNNTGGAGSSTRNYARPNLIGDPFLSHPTSDEYFNITAFAIPSFSYGNFGRNVLRSSSVKTVDFSLFKMLPLGEIRRLEFRAEAFNVLNVANFAAPSGVTIGVAGVGRVTTLATLPRTLQLGLRFAF